MGGFEILPYQVPASQMNYNAVARLLLDGFNGTSGSLPNAISAGSSYSHSYSTTPLWDVNHLFVVGMVIRNSDSVALNVVKLPVEIATGTAIEAAKNSSAFIFPDPSDELTTLRLSLLEPEHISIQIINELGSEFYSHEENFLSGTHQLKILTSDFTQGIYHVIMKAGDEISNRKLVIVH